MQKLKIRINILKTRIKEYIFFDSIVFNFIIDYFFYTAGVILYKFNRNDYAFKSLSVIHRKGNNDFFVSKSEIILKKELQNIFKYKKKDKFYDLCFNHIQASPTRANKNLANNPEKLLKNMAIVIASAQNRSKKGIIILKYNYVFPLFAKYYDIKKILEHYHIILEPSWSGYCTEDILCYSSYQPYPVFIQTYEKYDYDFINNLNINLKPISIAANWWINPQMFFPDSSVEKDLDFIMVASWADFKRHHRFFKTLKSLRLNGHVLYGACVGYPAGRTMLEINERADYYGVSDQITFHEFISPSDVAQLMRRSKTNIVWSRKEGFNRTIIEGMFCDVPCIIPEKFNYGYKYPFINPQTGAWSNDYRLGNDLLEMVSNYRYYSPFKWVNNHMTPHHAIDKINNTIRYYCDYSYNIEHKEIVPKVNSLHSMHYLYDEDKKKFDADYRCLYDYMQK